MDPSRAAEAEETVPAGDVESPRATGFEIKVDLYCQGCGYNLRGLTGERCPECGRSLETIRSTVSQIPWVHRKRLGRFRAYWKTVGMAMFRQPRFCEEMARHVSYPDSQRFRWLTILHAYVPILLGTTAFYVGAWSALPRGFFWGDLITAVWPVVGLHVCLVLFLIAATGVPSYFFHPSEMPVELQNRAIALSYYACGPLAVTALPVAALVIALAVVPDTATGICLALAAHLFALGELVAWWSDIFRIARRIMPGHRGRATTVAICVPILWVLLGGFAFIGLPLAVALVIVAFASLA
jgi:hypothetical protein